MSTFSALRTGLSRGFGSPGLLLLLWGVNFLAAVPLALAVGSSIHASVSHTLVAEGLETGLDTDWLGEHEARARGVEGTLRPSQVGVGAFLDNLEAWWSGGLFEQHLTVVCGGVVFALLWAFLLGGVLQRFARPSGFEGSVLSQTFFGNAGRFFGRFVRLALLSGLVYLALYALARGYFRLLQSWTRDVTSERAVLAWVLVGAAVLVLALVVVRLVFDYAKVMTVVEDRRGMLLAAWSGLRFVAGNPGRVLGLYLGMALLGALLLLVYAFLAPTAGPASWVGLVLAFLLAQLVPAAKLGLRISLLAGEMALYRATSGPEARRRARKARDEADES